MKKHIIALSLLAPFSSSHVLAVGQNVTEVQFNGLISTATCDFEIVGPNGIVDAIDFGVLLIQIHRELTLFLVLRCHSQLSQKAHVRAGLQKALKLSSRAQTLLQIIALLLILEMQALECK
ncbi:hypothetical protein QYZ44_17845 [Vibrio parahaemolyticus]|nr:hypothetical protein [Vibrio parahaemolyticus]MDN4711073.1 hypothetical protein [Vibrio parahaemolyticus]